MERKYLIITRKGANAEVQKYRAQLNDRTLAELVESYNNSVKVGIVGSYSQALYLYAMRMAFLDKINESPVLLEQELIISLTGPVVLDNGKLIPLTKSN